MLTVTSLRRTVSYFVIKSYLTLGVAPASSACLLRQLEQDSSLELTSLMSSIKPWTLSGTQAGSAACSSSDTITICLPV